MTNAYVWNESNLKLPNTLNRGFSLATGDYLTWTSDDNLYMDNALERMVLTLRTGDCDFVYADYYLFADLDEAGNPVDALHDRLPDRLQLEKTNHIGACFLYTRWVYDTVGQSAYLSVSRLVISRNLSIISGAMIMPFFAHATRK